MKDHFGVLPSQVLLQDSSSDLKLASNFQLNLLMANIVLQFKWLFSDFILRYLCV